MASLSRQNSPPVNRATIGGMINTDASGQGSLVYGKTSAHVLAVTAVLEDGTQLEASPLQGEALTTKLWIVGGKGRFIARYWLRRATSVWRLRRRSQVKPFRPTTISNMSMNRAMTAWI